MSKKMKQDALGIIPALAGNTDTMNRWSGAAWDHPRACGEHPLLDYVAKFGMGSSPRLRGTRCGLNTGMLMLGIIPALAGNTPASHRCRSRSGDHPRACGEHALDRAGISMSEGSSPRLRGTPVHRPRSVGWPGIIPALAGNT